MNWWDGFPTRLDGKAWMNVNVLLDKLRAFLTELPLDNDTVLIAVSGGPDSVALLRALVALREEFPIQRLGIAHMNHQLRGAESDADERFIHGLYEQLTAQNPGHLTWRSVEVDIPHLAQERKQSIETTARTMRYEWLAALAQEWQARWVATGHTADDQAETVLHRLLRGTGMKGLRGIPARRPLAPGVEVIRPLLQVTRQEVLAFLDELKQSFRTDSTNEDLHFTRNRIRKELLPLLREQYNPALVSVLCHLAQQAEEMYRAESKPAEELLQEAELPRAGKMLIFNQQCLADKSPQQIRSLFRLVWERENWSQQHMGFKEWQKTVDVAHGKETAVDLPGPVRVRRHGRVLQVGRLSS